MSDGSERQGPRLACPGCGSPHLDIERGLLCGECADLLAVVEMDRMEAVPLAAPEPGLCLCSHLRGSHQAMSFDGSRHGPCIIRSCGCGSYRPDPRGAAGRQQQEARSA